jgi:hypothetical protein
MLYDPMGAKISQGALTFRLSSTYTGSPLWNIAYKCNDGVIDDTGCASVSGDANPTLTITFSCPSGTTNVSQVMSKVVVYNRAEQCCTDRILDFKMDFLGPDGIQMGDSFFFNPALNEYSITSIWSGKRDE